MRSECYSKSEQALRVTMSYPRTIGGRRPLHREPCRSYYVEGHYGANRLLRRTLRLREV